MTVPKVVLAPSLARWLTAVPSAVSAERSFEVPGSTLRDCLEALFGIHPHLRGYVLDEQRHFRHHVIVYINGEVLSDKTQLHQPVSADAEIHLLQALSGG
jgi:molybdopterin synthase sulfur carrier subunit